MWQIYKFFLSLLFSIKFCTPELHCADLQECISRQNIPSVFRKTNSEIYAQFNKSFQLKPPATAPLAFILPRNEADVVATVLCCRAHHIRLVPKGGGHSYEKYSFGTRESVVVDLRALDEVKVNKDSSTVIVGPGNLVAPLSYKLWQAAGLILPVTNCPTVGIATCLGGGLGAFVGTYGSALDHILEMRVVLANGTVAVASAKKKQNLFWALRGAGAQSFGIVTQFKFQAVKAPLTVFEAMLTYDIDQLAEVMNVWQHFLAPDDKPNNVTTKIFSAGNGQFSMRFTDVGGHALNLEKLLPLLPQPSSISQITRSYPDYIFYWAKTGTISPDVQLSSPEDMLQINRSSQPSIYILSKSFFVQKIVGLSELTKFQALYKNMPNSVNLFFESTSGALRSIGIHDTAFVHRGFTLFNAITYYQTSFPNATANAAATAFVDKFWNIGKTLFDHKETYQNDVEGDLTNYLRRYYGTNLERLVKVKEEYDPENYFQYPQSIPTSLP